jgi:spore protease
MKFEVRTDLAVEEKESFPGDGGEIAGVSLREWRDNGFPVKFTEVKVLDEEGAQAMGKPVGTYLTMEVDRLMKDEDEYQECVVQKLGEQIRACIRRFFPGKDIMKNVSGLSDCNYRGQNHDDRCSVTGEEDSLPSILVVGLGNPQVTPDALGPRVITQLQVTRHLNGQYGEDFCKKRKLPVVSAIIPGVMAQTGMETAEILKGIIDQTSPELLIVIDALAARSVHRLGTTIQLTDTGIHPGSGVGNHRHSLTRETLGIPVLAIGVPTVVGAAAIVHDTVRTLTRALLEHPMTRNLGDFLEELDPEEQYAMIRQLLEPEFGALYVTPPDIDQIIRTLSTTISAAIETAVFS